MLPQQIDIKGYDGKYYVTIDGDVFRRYKSCDRKLKPWSRHRHYSVSLTDDKGKKKERTINSIMKRAYFNCDDKNYGVYHKNGVKADCSYGNLKLVDAQTLGKLGGGKSTSKTVLKICKETNAILGIYPSARKAAKSHYVSRQTMSDYCNGRTKNTAFPDFKFAWEQDMENELYGGGI